MTTRSTRIKSVLEARGWTYLRFRREYERTARELGLGAQTVGRRQFERWVGGSLATSPRPDACMILERLLGEPAAALLSSGEQSPAPSGPVPLVVAIALVVHDGAVLLVRRLRPEGEGRLDWQFPAGIVKPSDQAAQTAAAEVAAETGIAVNVRDRLGSRVHPITGALCEYFLCDYLHGQPVNLDPQENAEVAWVPINSLDRYIDPALIYGPARDALARCGQEG